VDAATKERDRVESIHPAIDRALCAFPRAVADRAGWLLRAALVSRIGREGQEPWRGSRLTGDGMPFELSFCTADRRLRFTAEPGAPGLAPARRLDAAVALLRQFDAGVPPVVVDACRAMQRDAPLAYGAWMGGRVSQEAHALKLYVEVPEEACHVTWPMPRLALADRTGVLRMVAYSNAAIECYARVPSLEPRHLPAVLAPAGLEHRAAELLALLADAYGHAIRGRVPGPSVGVSYVSTGSTPSRVTLFLFARSLWGPDARIRREFVRMAGAHGWDPRTYLEVTSPMSARESWQTHHGLVAVALDGEAMSVAIGVRPVHA
jgi:hypothetical protein